MVNYCCVKGCRKNSRTDTKLNFYSLPKEKRRQLKWLKACGRETLSDGKGKNSLRFCSRHFEPIFVKNRLLTATAVPTLFLEESDEVNSTHAQVHEDVICDSCKKKVIGFRYKCVTCKNYDICSSCERNEVHSHHYMIRMPVPTKSKTIEELTNKIANKLKENADDLSLNFNSDSSDNEPITKYVSKNHVELSNAVKKRIQDEVTRVLSLNFKENAKGCENKSNESDRKEELKSENCVETCFEADDSIDEQFFGFLKRKKPVNFVNVCDGREQESERNDYTNNVQQEQRNNIDIAENILELR